MQRFNGFSELVAEEVAVGHLVQGLGYDGEVILQQLVAEIMFTHYSGQLPMRIGKGAQVSFKVREVVALGKVVGRCSGYY
jgi:hypothetical protein